MVKMTDVARHAGVSIATVSRVLSGANVVSADTHKRVMDVIAETGYAINQTAQSLSMQPAENIGLLVSEAVYKTRYFPELIRLTTQFAQEHNKKLIITDARADAEDERQGIARLENQQCAVILIMSVSMGSAELGRIIERSTSDIILINKRLRQNPRHAIWVDYQPCTLRLVEMLTRYERDDIAILGDFSPGTPDCEIIEQFRCAARKLKLPRLNIIWCPAQGIFRRGAWPCQASCREKSLYQPSLPVILKSMMAYHRPCPNSTSLWPLYSLPLMKFTIRYLSIRMSMLSS
ncbi:LacI family DNA-binding transcriptional regulator [Citrobacter portucalensis]|uniref:LacI family DNA-binding transcriptional regulator n=1 Tax=Citrobacter portucalensis TaxID=1639133 RepID=UPI001747FF7A|nr:LacI family DNA-binding transcriptional regulator [Citrobacter portucalensis]